MLLLRMRASLLLGPRINPFSSYTDRPVTELDVLQTARRARIINCVYADSKVIGSLTRRHPRSTPPASVRLRLSLPTPLVRSVSSSSLPDAATVAASGRRLPGLRSGLGSLYLLVLGVGLQHELADAVLRCDVGDRAQQREAATLTIDRVHGRAGNVTLRPLPLRRSQTANPISFKPSSAPSVKCSSASASLPWRVAFVVGDDFHESMIVTS